MEALLNYMLQRTDVNADGLIRRRTVSLDWRQAYSDESCTETTDKVLDTLPKIEEFEVGYTPRRISPGRMIVSLFIRGPLAKLDYGELESRLGSAYN